VDRYITICCRTRSVVNELKTYAAENRIPIIGRRGQIVTLLCRFGSDTDF